jgi:mannose-1-phosphate guanylyltransferase/mannose-6-phosphate isomerase
MKHAIILAGGVGTRFWPLSSDLEPKQFLSIGTQKPMLEETILKLSSVLAQSDMYIATGARHKAKVLASIKAFKLPLDNILFEPQGRNTLAPIAVLTKYIYTRDKDAVILVLPCDHFVRNKKLFVKTLRTGYAQANNGSIITLGIKPTRPETGYGYIKVRKNNPQISDVDCFIEKPDLKHARQYVKNSRYFWNGGVFLFRADVMLGEIKRLQPSFFASLNALTTLKNIAALWPSIPATSIDYAIMEKTDKLKVIPADYGWLDVGSWSAIEEIEKKDASGNIFKGLNVDLDSKNSLVWTQGQPVATLGLENIIVVTTKNAVLVCAKNRAQDVKKIAGLFNKKMRGNDA